MEYYSVLKRNAFYQAMKRHGGNLKCKLPSERSKKGY